MPVIYKVEGRHRLSGQVEAQGLPGAAVAGMAAAILTNQTVTLRNVPHLPALDRLLVEMRGLGIEADWTHYHEITIKASEIQPFPLLTVTQLVSRLPLMVAAIVVRCGVCRLELHTQDQGGLMQLMEVIRKFGGLVEVQDGLLRLAFPHRFGAVMAMQTLDVQTCLASMLLSIGAEGTTELKNLPNDPQLLALQAILLAMGVTIQIHGSTWTCQGNSQLRGANIVLPADPMEVGLFAVAALATGGDVAIKGVSAQNLTGFLAKLRQLGAGYRVDQSELRFWRDTDEPWQPVSIEATPYPGVPANWLPMLMPLLVEVNGEASLAPVGSEVQLAANILRGLGGEFYFGDSSIKIFGPLRLVAGKIKVTSQADGLAALVSALAAAGVSELTGMEQVEGQFEHLSERLQKLGAKIERVEANEERI